MTLSDIISWSNEIVRNTGVISWNDKILSQNNALTG